MNTSITLEHGRESHTTVVHPPQVTANQTLLVSKPQQSVATVTPGKKDTVPENPTRSNTRNNHMHSLPE